ncbi:Wzz/FepE/Etk N-terminal domain-containing protein [Geodermatophilus nigrescens]
MDLYAILQSLRRHWVLTVGIAVATAVAIGGVLFLMPRDYEATASYVLVNPDPGPSGSEVPTDPGWTDVNRNNPYLRFANQATVSQVLAARVSGDSVRESLIAAGADSGYSIAPSVDFGGSGYIIDIVGTGSSSEEALRTLEVVVQRMQDELRAMQRIFNADDSALITALPVAEPTGARLIVSGTIRSLVGIGGAGVIALFAAISIAEARASAPKRPRARGEEAGGRHGLEARQTSDADVLLQPTVTRTRNPDRARTVNGDTPAVRDEGIDLPAGMIR